MMYKTRLAALLLLLSGIYVNGCFASKENNIPVPLGGKWLLIEMYGEMTIPDGTFLYINPETRAYQISAGCNNFNGGYELAAEKITFDAPAGTKKFCAELTSFETGYVRLITGAEQMQISRNVLQLFKNGELLLAFRKHEQ